LDHGFEFSRWPVDASRLLFLDAFEDAVKRSKELAASGQRRSEKNGGSVIRKQSHLSYE